MPKLILLIVAILGLLLTSHYVIHVTFVRPLGPGPAARRALLGALLGLSLSFPVSLVLLLNGWQNAFSRGLYLFSAVWLGLAINLLLTRLIYRGRDHGLFRDGSFQLYVSSGTGTFGPPLRTAGRSEIVVMTLRRRTGDR